MATIQNLVKCFQLRCGAYKINLCSGPVHIDGYVNVDIKNADIVLDMERDRLPFPADSASAIVCISSINYFSKGRAQIIIEDVYKILKKNGVARFATQDLESIAQKYVNKDGEFFFQKLPDGRQRFKGETPCDMLNSWFYGGYQTAGNKFSKYFYDYETLALMFKRAGFENIRKKHFRESLLVEVDQIDNRPEQMFFLEAVK